MKQYHRSGQTLLITVLVLTIAITVALSVITKTTTDVGISGKLEESSRAFSAAEAGIEDALKRATGTTVTIQSGDSSATYTTTVATIAGSSDIYTMPTITKKGDVVTVWLVPHTDDGEVDESGTSHYCQEGGACEIDVCFADTGTKAAMEIATLYKKSSTYAMARIGVDPDRTRGAKLEDVDATSGVGCGKETGVFRKRITLPTTGSLPIMLRIRPYHSATTLSFAPVGGRTLPSQGLEVSSVGKTESGVSRKIVLRKSFEAPSGFLDYSVYTDETAIKKDEE